MELARLEYRELNSESEPEYNRSIDIEFDDAVELIRFCNSNSIEIKIEPELTNNRRFTLANACNSAASKMVPSPDLSVS